MDVGGTAQDDGLAAVCFAPAGIIPAFYGSIAGKSDGVINSVGAALELEVAVITLGFGDSGGEVGGVSACAAGWVGRIVTSIRGYIHHYTGDWGRRGIDGDRYGCRRRAAAVSSDRYHIIGGTGSRGGVEGGSCIYDRTIRCAVSPLVVRCAWRRCSQKYAASRTDLG